MPDEVSTDAPVAVPPVVVEDQAPPVEVPTEEKPEEKAEHPLEPGGDRFKQVWARAKKAEADLQRERETRIAAETELKVRKEVHTPAPAREKIYTNAELETAIEQGTITRAQASDYREREVIKAAATEARESAEREFREKGKSEHVLGELDRYAKAVPQLLDTTTPERQQVEDEYAWLVNMHGKPKPDSKEQRVMELTAIRTVFGTVDTIEKKRGLDRVARESRESSMETQSQGRPSTTSVDGPPKGMPEHRVEHYKNMFKKTNDYPGGWPDVHVEIDEYTKRTGKRLW